MFTFFEAWGFSFTLVFRGGGLVMYQVSAHNMIVHKQIITFNIFATLTRLV